MEEIALLERKQAPLRNSLQALVSEREELRKSASQKEQTLEEELQEFRVRQAHPAALGSCVAT